MLKTDGSSHTSDTLHNQNCYHYLNHILLSDCILRKIQALSEELYTGLIKIKSPYQAHFPYGDLYQLFFQVLEKHVESSDPHSLAFIFEKLATEYQRSPQAMSEEHQQQLNNLTRFFFSLYANESKILELTFDAIKKIPLTHFPQKTNIRTAITHHIRNDGKVNKKTHSPVEVGKPLLRLITVLKSNYKPQHTTNLASLRRYAYLENIHPNQPHTSNQLHTSHQTLTPNDAYIPKEYRFGTQGQFHNGTPRISPLFEQWLKVKAFMRAAQPAQENIKTPITHIYINNLGRDRNDYAGLKESKLTQALHHLEDKYANLCVITLPADKGQMRQSHYKKIGDSHSATEVYKEFLAIALDEETIAPLPRLKLQIFQALRRSKPSTDCCIKDFYISERTRQLLFSINGIYSKAFEKRTLEQLLDHSFDTFGFSKTGTLTTAQKQALWFHFLKCDLTHYIFDTLRPDSINFTCKDAIDRGGVSSVYYHLMRSYETEYPLSREEFEQGLHAAPTLVKGRGINYNLHLLWNVIDTYLDKETHYEAIRSNPKTQWLIDWRDFNCPRKRASFLLPKRLIQAHQAIEQTLATVSCLQTVECLKKARLLKQGLRVIQQIRHEQLLHLDNKQQLLLLETVTRTLHLLLRQPDESNLIRYEELAIELRYSCISKTIQFLKHQIPKTLCHLWSRKICSRDKTVSDSVMARKQTIESILKLIIETKKEIA